ncbi:hypothetical protein GCM10011375_21590 [Hymenobacter qilianensis]|uniref:Uncharacterized protein n=2 Tax=Hymenobacter qilianensis TaxID=1385715 RepID=A0ACB5PRW0_9BACT|nr:KTSC domain-containing protein [Hymenobacter qilianensis]QNP52300.1 KTSC domain-containing protein [Hymenobacter qilianensis]GGF66264.1 hypothetical protein GCM10011375_21590 [Hymenobacter qilianensis]
MKCQPVRSTSLKAVGYDPATLTLEIEYRNGRLVRYTGASAAVHQALLTVPGKALFVEQVVEKSGYIREQVE